MSFQVWADVWVCASSCWRGVVHFLVIYGSRVRGSSREACSRESASGGCRPGWSPHDSRRRCRVLTAHAGCASCPAGVTCKVMSLLVLGWVSVLSARSLTGGLHRILAPVIFFASQLAVSRIRACLQTHSETSEQRSIVCAQLVRIWYAEANWGGSWNSAANFECFSTLHVSQDIRQTRSFSFLHLFISLRCHALPSRSLGSGLHAPNLLMTSLAGLRGTSAATISC